MTSIPMSSFWRRGVGAFIDFMNLNAEEGREREMRRSRGDSFVF